jgi:hypothetical protein
MWTPAALELLQPDEIILHHATRIIADAWWEFLDERELVAQ